MGQYNSPIVYTRSGNPCYIWQGTANTLNGIATFDLTDENGNALLRGIESVYLTAYRNTTNPTQAPSASIKNISVDMKTAIANVVTGVTLSVLGNTISFAPDGTRVDLIIIGY